MRVEERTDMGERYLVDVTTGEKVIAGSRRPDGSYRKEIRVRPGYTPMVSFLASCTAHATVSAFRNLRFGFR